MARKVINIAFCAAFALLLAVPLALTNFSDESVSVAENRKLAAFPALTKDDGSVNGAFFSGVDTWFGDRVGLRRQIIAANGLVQYKAFGRMGGDFYLGPRGEFNYATAAMIADYQRFNLRPEAKVREIADAYAKVCDWVEGQGIQFYYYQCWDKHTICPEQFPGSVNQYGDGSKTDQVVSALGDALGERLINPKAELLAAKERSDPYGHYSDPSHWSRRGSYVGYRKLMDALNARNGGRFRVLGEEDYDLSLTDQGNWYYGSVHEEDWLEAFTVKSPTASRVDDGLTLLSEDARHGYWRNESAGNDTRLLIVGDSYFAHYLMDDIPESFGETVLIWGDYVERLPEIVDAYQPDILVLECAERVDRSGAVLKLAGAL